jgi:rhodanese-related sulfurtransferase
MKNDHIMNKAIEVTPAAAFELIEKGALLVDVREPDEVAEATFDIAGVALIPYRTFEAHFQEIPADRNVVIGCNVGERSLMATWFLMNHGYDKAVNLQDGIVGWAEAGLPVQGKLKHTKGGCCCGGSKGHGENNGGNCC